MIFELHLEHDSHGHRFTRFDGKAYYFAEREVDGRAGIEIDLPGGASGFANVSGTNMDSACLAALEVAKSKIVREKVDSGFPE